MSDERSTRGARKHHGGRASAQFVMAAVTPEERVAPQGEPLLWWVGVDERGRELEVGAVVLSDGTHLVIHVMPTALRQKGTR